VGVSAADNRLFVEARLYRYRAGFPGRDLPERFGDWRNEHRRVSRRTKPADWHRVSQHLAADADNEWAMIDSTIVRAHQHSAGAPKKGGQDQAIGRSRGGLRTKIHTLVDSLGAPIGFHLTGSRAHDLIGVDHLRTDMQPDTLTADRAFDADKRVIEPPTTAGKATVIPSKASRL
jgi:transposase